MGSPPSPPRIHAALAQIASAALLSKWSGPSIRAGTLMPVDDAVTDLLRAHGAGDGDALDRLTPLVYDELRQLAHRQLARERPGHTLQTTGLVHEAFVKLVSLDRIEINDRAHFFALSARLMRQILTDYARRRRALKRDPIGPVMLHAETERSGGLDLEDLVDLDDALRRLEGVSHRQARIVECRFFGGMTVAETGRALEISPATVKRDWQVARAWLNRALA